MDGGSIPPASTTSCTIQRVKKFLTYAEQKERYGKRFIVCGIICRIRKRAAKAGRECLLTPTDFWAMWKKQAGKCFYTGRPMVIGCDHASESSLDSVSVDRVDNAKGYTVDNVVLCCLWVNNAKLCGTIDALVERARALVQYAGQDMASKEACTF